MTTPLRFLLAIALAAVALAAAACGDSGDDPAASATTVTTAPGATGPTLTAAAADFTALVAPLNAEVRQINAGIAKARTTDDVAAVVAPLERLSAVTGTFIGGLRTIAVPASVQRQVDDTLAAAVAQREALDALLVHARTGSLPAGPAQTWTASLFEMSGRAAALRDALGLPPAG